MPTVRTSGAPLNLQLSLLRRLWGTTAPRDLDQYCAVTVRADATALAADRRIGPGASPFYCYATDHPGSVRALTVDSGPVVAPGKDHN